MYDSVGFRYTYTGCVAVVVVVLYSCTGSLVYIILLVVVRRGFESITYPCILLLLLLFLKPRYIYIYIFVSSSSVVVVVDGGYAVGYDDDDDNEASSREGRARASKIYFPSGLARCHTSRHHIRPTL